MTDRQKRRTLILELVSSRAVGSQRELAELLESHGVSTTQATLSRDIRELGLVKAADGGGGYRYKPPSAGGAARALAGGPVVKGIDMSGNLLVVHTEPGFAQSIAAALDRLGWPELLGTVGGDDTVLVVLADGSDADDVRGRLRLFLNS